MYGLNQVMLIGNIGNIDASKSGDNAVCNFSLATNESYKDKSGTMIERTEWHKCVAFRKSAEVISAYATKGTKMYVSGKLKTEKWTDTEGVERYTTKIIVDEFLFLGGKQNGTDNERYTSDDDLGF